MLSVNDALLSFDNHSINVADDCLIEYNVSSLGITVEVCYTIVNFLETFMSSLDLYDTLVAFLQCRHKFHFD